MVMSLRDHFRKGASHWNKFIESYDGGLIDFELGTFKSDPLDLTGYRFPIPTKFYGCTFKGAVRIEHAEFDAWVSFSESTFEKELIIKETKFEGEVDFESARCSGAVLIDNCEFDFEVKFDDLDVMSGLHISDSRFQGDVSLTELGAHGGLILSKNKFENEVSFSGIFQKQAILLSNKFDGFVDFKLANFEAPLILRGNVFKYRPAIDQIFLSYIPILPDNQMRAGPPLIFRYHDFLRFLKRINGALALRVALTLAVARTDDSYSTLRQFRLFAQEYDDRRLALEIYALEQKSRRLWYDAPLSKTFVLGLLFQLFSDFGRSVWRPLGTLVALFVVSTSSLLALSNSVDCASTMRFKSSLLLSLNNTLPFLAWQKSSLLSAAESCLFSLGGGGLPYGLLSTIQMATSLTLLFLAGLAIRNTLKMQS